MRRKRSPVAPTREGNSRSILDTHRDEERRRRAKTTRQWAYCVMEQNGQSLRERSGLVQLACQYGCPRELKFLEGKGCKVDENTWCQAAYAGHSNVLEHLKNTNVYTKPYKPRALLDYFAASCAARGGHLEVLKWLHRQGYWLNEDICVEAARGGHLEVLIASLCDEWTYL